MEIQGKVIQILVPQTFTTRNGEMTRHSFVLETTGTYPKKLKFDVLKEEAWNNMNVTNGSVINVSFDAESREWQGKWYTSLTCWRIQSLEQGAVSQPQQQTQPVTPATPVTQPSQQSTTSQANSNNDELPF